MHNLIWLQSGGCGGCSMSLLCAQHPSLPDALANAGIRVLWHPALSEASGDEALAIFDAVANDELALDLLCLEGAVMRGPNGSGRFHMLAGTDQPMFRLIDKLARKARAVVAVGSCAAYGGITAAGANPTEACGLQFEGAQTGGLLGPEFRSGADLPVVNVAGCPVHPGWVTESLQMLAQSALDATQSDATQSDAIQLDATQLDDYARPRFYADQLVHHGCPRNEYYEYKASAEKPSDLGCLMEHLGCLGTQAHADCNTRLWNGEGSCLRGGYACINCTAPEFEEPGHSFANTPKVAGIPVGLPTDMPRAWFVALASLSKAATPKRLRENSVSDHVVVTPVSRIIKRG